MKSNLTRLMAVSFLAASVIAIPTAVKAQSDTLIETGTVTATESAEINSELNYCFQVPGWGWICM